MKIIISRILNKTDLGINKSHGELVVGADYEDMMDEFFVERNKKQKFTDMSDGEEFEIWFRKYENDKTPNPRVAPLKTYMSKHNLQPGDTILFEKNNIEGESRYLLEYARRMHSGFFKGLNKTSVEVLNIEQFAQLVTEKIKKNEIRKTSANAFVMDCIYSGIQGQLLIQGNSETLEIYFNGEHIEEFNKYYELEMVENPYLLKKIPTWSIEIELEESEIDANEKADFELVKSLDLDDDNSDEDGEVYSPYPEEKSEKKMQNGHLVPDRNKNTARKAIKRAEYKCEYDITHASFLRKNTFKPYMEPHHLIPLQFEDEFDKSLDVQANIVSLCSECHNRIHYGAHPEKIITELWNQRKNDLYEAGITTLKNGAELDLVMLLSFYGIR